MPTGEATITSRRPPTLERSTDQTYPMEEDTLSDEELKDAVDRALTRDRPLAAENKKKEFIDFLRNLADIIEAKYPDELFEHESSKEGKEEVYSGYRKLRTANRLLNTRL